MKEVHHNNLENLKYTHKNESPEEFLLKLQSFAMEDYPTPVDQPLEPFDGTVVGDQDRFDRETREDDNRRKFAQMERETHN